MRKLFLFGLLISVSVIIFSSCEPTTPEPPVQQNIVYSDSSLITGQLTADVVYYDEYVANFIPAPSGTVVYLYATYEDLLNNLPLYSLQTAIGNSVYFGYLNYGNYYILATTPLDSVYYEGLSAVQVRPNREELLHIIMFNTDLNNQ